MSGGIESYQRALADRPFRAVAMSVFASGAIAPREALEWIFAQPNIESVVFGASSRANIENTRALVDEFTAELT
jgi:aryl-alcohol dehydrogenase-like predicted oxidoreductase